MLPSVQQQQNAHNILKVVYNQTEHCRSDFGAFFDNVVMD